MSLPVIDLTPPTVPLSELSIGDTFMIVGQAVALYQRADPIFLEGLGAELPEGQILVNVLNNGTQSMLSAGQACTVKNVAIVLN